MCDIEAEDSGNSNGDESGSDMDWFESDFIDDDDAPKKNVVYGEGLDDEFCSEDEEEYFSESNGPESSDEDEEEDDEERKRFLRLEEDQNGFWKDDSKYLLEKGFSVSEDLYKRL